MFDKGLYITQIDQLIGKKILWLRRMKGLSRQQLSQAIGVTHQQLHKYEKGINRLSAGRLALIAKVLEKPVSYFFRVDEEIEEITEEVSKSHIEMMRHFSQITSPEKKTVVNQLLRVLSS